MPLIELGAPKGLIKTSLPAFSGGSLVSVIHGYFEDENKDQPEKKGQFQQLALQDARATSAGFFYFEKAQELCCWEQRSANIL